MNGDRLEAGRTYITRSHKGELEPHRCVLIYKGIPTMESLISGRQIIIDPKSDQFNELEECNMGLDNYVKPEMIEGNEYAILCDSTIWESYRCEAISNGIAMLVSKEDGSVKYKHINNTIFTECIEEVDCSQTEKEEMMSNFIHKIIVKYELSYEDQNEAWNLIGDEGGYYAG